MRVLESIIHYYQTTGREVPPDLLKSRGQSAHFNVLKRKKCLFTLPYQRRDYYKICLTRGDAILRTDTREMIIDQPAIFFSAPDDISGYRSTRENQDGYVCLFNEPFLSPDLKKEFRKLQKVLADQPYSFLFLSNDEYEILAGYFYSMQREYHSDFYYKKNIIQSLLRIIIYTAIQIQHSREQVIKGSNKNDRLLTGFLRLLNSQFPLDAPGTTISYKTPADFSRALHVHVNHLNHSLQKLVGKSTSQIINERITTEAMDLLKNSDWRINEISDSLGFEYSQHFSQFFKKQTGQSPRSYRYNI